MKTIAFVLGNNDYFEGAQLKCAVNDATEMAAIFRRLGYDVFEKLNFKSEECSSILSSFEDRIKFRKLLSFTLQDTALNLKARTI